jgi:glycosyltransferase involved in cell wall biosynthesis
MTAGNGAGRAAPSYAVVVPTLGRDTLTGCLAALAAATGPPPARVVLVDDRPPGTPRDALPLAALGGLRHLAVTADGGGRGPAAARNTGLRALAGIRPDWVVFLDDDVRVGADWRDRLAEDLAGADVVTGGVQGVLEVPLPADRAPTDWERNTAGLRDARWATADMAYRTAVLEAAGGFDERFPRAFREDADLALRVMDAGWDLRRGGRRTSHPVRHADPWVSVRVQRGNADDALMRRLHGTGWHHRAGAPRGRIRRHALTTGLGAAAPLLALAGRRRAAACAAAGWALATAEFAWARIAPGPRTGQETVTMLATSVLIPPLATLHRFRGELVGRRAASADGGPR